MKIASTAFIEISGRCNAKCPYCAQRRLKQSNYLGTIMSPIFFKQLIEHLFKIGIISKNINSIPLYNWGEPFLNIHINEILKILKKKKLLASISSNFIVKPELEPECLPIINDVIFSISGFSQDSYGRIHGASMDKVLRNFEDFYTKIRKYSPKTKIIISWHRYTFNENEFWNAYKYFNRPGITFKPVIAYLNDLLEMRNFIEDKLSKERILRAQKDLFLNKISDMIYYNKKKSKNYHCPAWDFIVIDERGQLVLCCGVTGYDFKHVLGNVLDMSAEEIWEKKLSDSFCNKCISSGLARYAYNTNYYQGWPSGGGINYLKLNISLMAISSKLGKLLKKNQYGGKIARMLRDLK